MPISTPCTRICALDPATGLCTGCGRTRDELSRWGQIGEAERLRIMAELKERMRRVFGAAPPRTAR